jgi:hypothetical protein
MRVEKLRRRAATHSEGVEQALVRRRVEGIGRAAVIAEMDG